MTRTAYVPINEIWYNHVKDYTSRLLPFGINKMAVNKCLNDRGDHRSDMTLCNILDSEHESIFDNIVYTSAQLFRVPMCAILFIDGERQWYKAQVGIGLQETERKHAFYADTINEDVPLIVPDATCDQRYAQDPFVTGPSQIRFYAGASLYGPSQSRLGALCLLDTIARDFDADNVRMLVMLAAQVSELLCARAAINMRPVGTSD